MSKAKFVEAEQRLFHRMFICMDCGAKLRADNLKVKALKVKCRKCRAKNLRAVRKHK